MKELVLPPTCWLLVIALGVLLVRHRPRTGRLVAASGFAALVLSCIPLVGGSLLWSLQIHAALDPVKPRSTQRAGPDGRGTELAGDAGAVVVLAAGRERHAPEYSGQTVGPWTLQRLRYGAHLARATGRPLLVSGGLGSDAAPALARLMADTLRRDFGIEPRWLEDRSGDTHENAVFTAAILGREKIGHIYLVTHAWHMPRAVLAFEQAGLECVPAPTAFREPPTLRLANVIPGWKGLRDTHLACHEVLGSIWYWIAY